MSVDNYNSVRTVEETKEGMSKQTNEPGSGEQGLMHSPNFSLEIDDLI